MYAVSPKSVGRGNRLEDVDELKFKTIRLHFGSRSWRGHKRLERDVNQLAKFRAVLDFVLSERIVDAKMMEKFPAFPLLAAFSIRGVRVVANAESLRDRFSVVAMDKRDLSELVQTLKITKMLRAFPYSDLPEVWLRKMPGNQETTLIGVSTRYDDVLLQSLRSTLVHGILIKASSGDGESLELLTAHDMKELVQHREAHWIPYLDMVYYQLESSAAPGAENMRAKSFLLHASSSPLAGDIVISVDVDKCRLPLDLKEGFVMKQQLEVHPLVRRLQDVKKNAARITAASGAGPATHKADPGIALAKDSEKSLKKLLVHYIKDFATQLLTLGDEPGVAPQLTRQKTIPSSLQPRSGLARSNTDSAIFGSKDYAAPKSSAEPNLRRRRSSLATAGAVGNTISDNSGAYVVDNIHLRQVMRESGVNMRFLPLVFDNLESVRQPGIQTLVASEIIARMAKTLFRYQLLNDGNVSLSSWDSRKLRLIKLIDSIMHGIFHDDLPFGRCPIQECVGDQFWNIDAPILLMLGPFSSCFGLDYSSISAGAAVAKYRKVLRGNPAVLFSALLHAFDAQLTNAILPDLHENRFVSMQFLRTANDIAFINENEDPTFAIKLHRNLLWSNLQFFRIQFEDLKRSASTIDHSSGFQKETSMSGDSHRAFFSEIVEHFRQAVNHSHETRIERAAANWEESHAVRSRLVKALRAANTPEGNRGIAREYCEEAKEIISSSNAHFPVEYLIALLCLEMVSFNEDQILSRSDEWKDVLAILSFFYRPANQSQFAKSSSSHPLFSIIYFMIHLGGIDGTLPEGVDGDDSLRTRLEIKQMQQAWLGVIATVDAHCRRTVARSWSVDPINAIATKAASFEFEKYRSVLKHSSSSSSSSLSSNFSDDRSDSMSSPAELKHAQTTRAMSTESKLTASAVRQDVLWFVECFFLPSVTTGSWTISGANFLRDMRSPGSSFSAHTKKKESSAPGVALMWGEPFGLSLDEESQLSGAAGGSRAAALQARPTRDGSQVDLLKFPSSLRRVVQVSCGYRHTALVTDNRYLYTFGYGECGRLGHGDEESVASPTAVGFFASLIETVGVDVGGISHVSCGREHTMAVLVNGDLYGFGWAEAGRLGTGDTGSCVFPTKVLSLQDVQAAACGREHTLALTKRGQVYAFGAGFGGRLGSDSELDEEYPVPVKGLDGETIVSIDAGECHSGAVSDKGEVFTWGFGSSGALGNGARENSPLPGKISGPWVSEQHGDGTASVITSIACGSYHTLVSTSTGKLYGWGDSAAGQLGDEYASVADMVVLTPQEIHFRSKREGVDRSPGSFSSSPSTTAIREIACGTFTSAVCLDDGKLFVWGSAAAGNGAQLNREDASIERVEALKEFSISRVSCGTCFVYGRYLLYHSLTRALMLISQERTIPLR